MEEVSKMSGDSNCIFCRILSGEIPSHRVAETEHCVAILDAFPATKGHMLILTKEHRADLLDMTDAELADAAVLSKRIGIAVQKALGCPGINFLSNLGATAGQLIMHSHFHVLPRYEGDPVGMTFGQIKFTDSEKEAIRAAIVEMI
jgi:histidine triad (HIT) family protein